MSTRSHRELHEITHYSHETAGASRAMLELLTEIRDELLQHGVPHSSVIGVPEGIGAEGSTDSPSAPAPDTAIRDALHRLADLIGDDYTVSVTWAPKGGAS